MKTTRKIKYKKVFSSLALPIFLVVPFVFYLDVSAETGGIVINEVMFDPQGADGTLEWIELYNDSEEVRSLNNWDLDPDSGSYVSLDGRQIEAKGFLLVGSISKMRNDKGQVSLYNSHTHKKETMVDYVQYGANDLGSTENKIRNRAVIEAKIWNADDFIPNISEGKSIGRTVDGADINLVQDWKVFNDGGTPGTENSKKQEAPADPPSVPISDEKENCTSVKLNEIFPFTDGEYVEVVNDEEHACDISGWRIEDNSGHKKIFPADVVIESGAFSVLEGKLYLNDDEDTVYLFDKKENKIDEAQYSVNSKQKDHSYSHGLSESGWIWTAGKTPGEENKIVDEEASPDSDIGPVVEPVIAPEIDKKTYAKDISITELFPNPFKSEYEEYIELYNGNYSDIDLSGWTLRDASKSGKYVFPRDIIIKAREYLAVFKKDFKFALNNSGKESVALFDPNNAEVSRIEYSGSKKGLSYSLDGERWRWTRFLTPEKENIFNNEPFGKIKIDEDVFENVYANFSVSTGDADGDKVKVTWDFGDKHKSYLPKTRHKYEKEGKYVGSVKLSDGSEDVVKNFSVEVKEFPHPKVRIVSVNANPFGADTGVESITVENKSKKKINLKGWSIATGWKKFVNHPIDEDVVIKKNKSKEITRKVSSFTLNNTKSKIQLRYPDGKVAHEVKYKSPNKSIANGEVYRKIEGGWEWISQKPITKIQDTNKIQKTITNTQNDTDAEKVDENNSEEITDSVEIKRENKLVSLNNENVKIELLKSQPRVLGAETVREIDGIYFFTPQASEQKHYAIVFLENIFSGLNLKLNILLNFFFR